MKGIYNINYHVVQKVDLPQEKFKNRLVTCLYNNFYFFCFVIMFLIEDQLSTSPLRNVMPKHKI